MPAEAADDFDQHLKPLFAQKCAKCHGNEEANAEINFQQFTTAKQLVEQPELLGKLIKAIDAGAMPPEGEPVLEEATREKSVAALTLLLHEASRKKQPRRQQLQRLNRFQYNNTVRDLFGLNRDVFALPEKLLTREDNYLHHPPEQPMRKQMPESVRVASYALTPQPGLQGVEPFPKDLRAEHGFDNQANQLTLSPLLLDAYIQLSVSIVDSPDFNEQSVGIWNEFFKEPEAGTDRSAEIKNRMAKFLRRAFRRPVDDETLGRYVGYATHKLDDGLSFPDTMKKVASAALSSPLFLYRTSATDDGERQFELASRLSYFLWASCPDEELLKLAETGTLSDPDVLDATVTRMLADPRIERFLDSFPSQWMQLENLLAATPDTQINKYFSLDPLALASLQMVVEPLLLFDAFFLEERPVVELIAPPFGYRSDFLQTWYTTELKPPTVDRQQIADANLRNDEERKRLRSTLDTHKAELAKLTEPIRNKLLEMNDKGAEAKPPVDLKPYAVWEFNGDLTESIRGLDLTAHDNIEFSDGMVVLDKAYLQSNPLTIDLAAKSLEVWFRLHNLEDRGGGLMGLHKPGHFDTIVIGERLQRRWMSGSNGFSRTEDFPDSPEETVVDDLLHLVMVYAEDGTTTLYRNGDPYGKPYRKGSETFSRDESTVIFGLRHLPPGGNRFLSVSIDEARLYDRALTAEEVGVSARGRERFVSTKDLVAAMTPEQQTQHGQLADAISQTREQFIQVPANVNPDEAQQQAIRDYEEGLKQQLRSHDFRRTVGDDPRFGGIITNAAMLSMTSGPKRTHPVARGVWVIEVIFNDPPDPPPNDVPPLDEETADKNLTIREQFAAHRANPSCAGCHTKLDPLGFALENFDITGRWRDQYDNGREVDVSGTLLRKHQFESVVSFKELLVQEERRFTKAFTEHLLRFALARELGPLDAVHVDAILKQAEHDGPHIKSIIREIVMSDCFLQGT